MTATSLGHVVGPPSPPQSPPLSPPLSATRGNGGEGKRQRRLRHCLRQQESNDDMECTRTQKREGRKACREERIRSGEAGGGGGGLLLPSSFALGLPPLLFPRGCRRPRRIVLPPWKGGEGEGGLTLLLLLSGRRMWPTKERRERHFFAAPSGPLFFSGCDKAS